MKTRCYNKKFPKYRTHGARGITVCERWRNSFEAFIEDMGPRPSPAHSLDRKNNDGDYEPDNCRWATAQEQASNRSTNRTITACGRTMLLKEWAKALGADPTTILGRLDRGWDPTRAVTAPPRRQRQRRQRFLRHNGRRLRLHEWARETGLTAATIHKRLRRGWSVARSLTEGLPE